MNSDLVRLMSNVASHLTGREVQVRFQVPAVKGAIAYCHYLPGNKACIDITPGLKLSEAYRWFLHETAHARHHYHPVPTEGLLHYKSASVPAVSGNRAVKVAGSTLSAYSELKERQADEQAEKWDRWAVLKTGENYPEEKLQALLKIKVWR